MQSFKSFDEKLEGFVYFLTFNLIIFPYIISGEVLSGNCNIRTCNGIIFSITGSATIKDCMPLSNTCSIVGNLGCCVKEILDSVDILYTNPYGFWDGSNLECGGFYCQFSSRDTIWKINKEPPSTYQDITPISRNYSDSCKWSINASQELTRCIPSIKKPVFLVRTYSKKFILIKVTSQKKINDNSSSEYCTADISWWLQDDGSCDFSTLSTSVSQKQKNVLKKSISLKNRFVVLSNELVLPEGNYYDYQGRKVNLKKNARKNNILIRITK